MSSFILSGTFEIFLLATPDPFPFGLGPPLCLAVFTFQPFTKLNARLCLVDGGHAGSQHLQAYVSSPEPFPHVGRSHHSAVLVYLVHMGANASSSNV